jgi:hypothetical protein
MKVMLQAQNWTFNSECKKGELLDYHGTSRWTDNAQNYMGYRTICEMHQNVFTFEISLRAHFWQKAPNTKDIFACTIFCL